MSKKKKKSAKKQAGKGGPNTPAGKATSSMNALDHGGYCKGLLPSESAAEFAAFRKKLWRSLAPADALEEMMAEEIIFDAWRLQRLSRFEGQKLQTIPEEEGEKAVWLDQFRKLTNLRGRIQRVRDRKLAELLDTQDERMRAECQNMSVIAYRERAIRRNLISHGAPRPFHPSQVSLDEFIRISTGGVTGQHPANPPSEPPATDPNPPGEGAEEDTE